MLCLMWITLSLLSPMFNIYLHDGRKFNFGSSIHQETILTSPPCPGRISSLRASDEHAQATLSTLCFLPPPCFLHGVCYSTVFPTWSFLLHRVSYIVFPTPPCFLHGVSYSTVFLNSISYSTVFSCIVFHTFAVIFLQVVRTSQQPH